MTDDPSRGEMVGRARHDDGSMHRAPDWLANSHDPLRLATAFTVIDPLVRDDLARRIFEHLQWLTARNAPPAGYQFLLPNGALLTVYDQVISGRRRLGLHAPRGPAKLFGPIRAWAWPRRVPDQGPWFSWPLSEKKLRKVHADIGYAVRVAFANRSDERRPRNILIDPYAEPGATG